MHYLSPQSWAVPREWNIQYRRLLGYFVLGFYTLARSMQWSGGRGSGGEGRGSYVTAVPSEFSGVVWRSLKFSRFSLLPPPLEPLNQPGGASSLERANHCQWMAGWKSVPRAEAWGLQSYRESQFLAKPESGLDFPRSRLSSARADERLQFSRPRIRRNQAEWQGGQACRLWTVWLSAECLPSLGLSFFLHKMGIIIPLTSQSADEGRKSCQR